MGTDLTRRRFIEVAGAAAAVGAVAGAGAAEAPARPMRIVAVCCSPRKGKTTAATLQVCLEAAKSVSPNVAVELIELAGMRIDGGPAAGVPLPPGQVDDFLPLVPKLSDASVGGLLIGTPVYFGNMTWLCKAFLDRCMVFRKSNFALRDKAAGVVAVGGVRNGGQELTIQSVQAALLCQEMILVGDGRPTAHTGATVWNNGTDDVTQDEFGMSTARNLGRRVAEVALRLAGMAG